MNRPIIRSLISKLTLSLILIFSYCSREDKYLSIDKPVYISDFPIEVTLDDGQLSNINAIGIKSIKYADSLVIIGHSNSWSIYSGNGEKHYGDFLSVGDGPAELNTLPYCASSLFINEHDTLYSYIEDHNRNRIVRLNLTKCLTDNKTVPETVLESDYLDNNLWATIPLSKDSVLLTIPKKRFDGFKRRILTGDTILPLPITRQLDSISVSDESEINLLAKVIRYNPKARKVVEAMLSLNQINIYSIDGDWGKTICVGEKLDNLAKIEHTPRFSRNYTYATVSTWDWGFGAVLLNQPEIDWQKGEAHPSEIQIFNWEGEPLCRLKINESIQTFDIDPGINAILATNTDDELKTFKLPKNVKELLSSQK